MVDNQDQIEDTSEVIELTEWDNAPSVGDLKQDLVDAQSDHDTQMTKISAWKDNLNITARCGSCFSLRLKTQIITFTRSCQDLSTIDKPHSFSFKTAEDKNDRIWSALDKLCPCGRGTWGAA